MRVKKFLRPRCRIRWMRRRLWRWQQRLSARRRRVIVLLLLTLFAGVNLWQILRGSSSFEVGHIEFPQINFQQHDSRE